MPKSNKKHIPQENAHDILDFLKPELETWKKQGRSDEQIFGVINFLTGQGRNGVKRLMNSGKAMYQMGFNDGKEEKIEPQKDEWEERFNLETSEDFFDLHIRACRIVDTDENKTQEWCSDFKKKLKEKLKSFIRTEIEKAKEEAEFELSKLAEETFRADERAKLAEEIREIIENLSKYDFSQSGMISGEFYLKDDILSAIKGNLVNGNNWFTEGEKEMKRQVEAIESQLKGRKEDKDEKQRK